MIILYLLFFGLLTVTNLPPNVVLVCHQAGAQPAVCEAPESQAQHHISGLAHDTEYLVWFEFADGHLSAKVPAHTVKKSLNQAEIPNLRCELN